MPIRPLAQPEDLTARQERKLAWIAKVNTALYRALLDEEQLRIAIRTKGSSPSPCSTTGWPGPSDAYPRFGRNSGGSSKRNQKGHRGSDAQQPVDALVESTNTKLRVLHRMAFGFKEPEHLIGVGSSRSRGLLPATTGPLGGVIDPRMCQESQIKSTRLTSKRRSRETGGTMAKFLVSWKVRQGGTGPTES